MIRYLAILVGISVLAAACTVWNGPAEIRLIDGTVLKCERGLWRNHINTITCATPYGDLHIPWDSVTGLTTK